MTETIAAAERRLRRVLVVTKKTTYQLEVVEKQDPHLLKLLNEGDVSVARLAETHREHLKSLECVCGELSQRGIEFKTIDRTELPSEKGSYELLISFGGDGTFLETAHCVSGVPVLGVNSATLSSHGHWCMASQANFASVLDEILLGVRQPLSIMRLQVLVNGKALPELVLNEVFVADPSPAGTSRYDLQVGERREQQRSSGVLVGPGAGSTGWMRTAGGTVLPVTSSRFQLLVREPCEWPGEKFELKRLLLERNEKVEIVPIMAEARIFIDGKHASYAVARGDQVVIEAALQDLFAYISPCANDGYLPA